MNKWNKIKQYLLFGLKGLAGPVSWGLGAASWANGDWLGALLWGWAGAGVSSAKPKILLLFPPGGAKTLKD